MHNKLPPLTSKDLSPTRDYLREVALVLGSLQRAFLPPEPHDWQHGLEVGMRGLSTQPFSVKDEEVRATFDLVKHKVRLAGSMWPLAEYAGPEMLNNAKVWLASRGVTAKLDEPEFAAGSRQFDAEQADKYAAALWWMDKQFRIVKSQLATGVASPILLYPHHFDLALSWFPHGDVRQCTLGWSTGDEIIAESYIYLTAYPEPAGFTKLELPKPAYWQTKGFSAAILPYAALQADEQPDKLLQAFAAGTLRKATTLFG